MSINANILKTISLHAKEKSNMSIIESILNSCLDRAISGKREHTDEINSYRVNHYDIGFIVSHFNSLNFDASSRFMEEDGYYEITVRW